MLTTSVFCCDPVFVRLNFFSIRSAARNACARLFTYYVCLLAPLLSLGLVVVVVEHLFDIIIIMITQATRQPKDRLSRVNDTRDSFSRLRHSQCSSF